MKVVPCLLYMRLPKKGFSNAPFKNQYAIVKLGQLDKKFEKGEINRESLRQKGLLKGRDRGLPIKVLGEGELSKSLVFVGIDKFSKSAGASIEKAGGEIRP